ncbi:MAG: glycosyltransferase, partial [Micrococcales bacterium]|nr:glycosyltransferase [Micrococcales bacterium]
MPQPHLLYVAWGFPPSRGGGVYRALATANGFARAGFRVTVLTATRETFLDYTGADESLEARVDPAVQVVRIPFDWPVMETDLRRWSALRAIAPRTWRKRQLERDVHDFPEIGYGPWMLPLQEAALAIHGRDRVDLCVATANPNVAFMAAHALHAEAGVPYVMDYRDAWMLDVFDGGLLHEEGGREDVLERALLAGALEVWFVNEPIRAWHARRHPRLADRFHVVSNGFDPEFAPLPRLTASDPRCPLTFGYVGTASAKVPLAQFAAGWRLARKTEPLLRDARAQLWGYLGFYSAPSSALLKLVEDYAADGLSYCGPVAKTALNETYSTFDACLLTLGTGAYVTSGKVFEYAATALPIVSVHDPGNAATDVLRGYPLWFPVADLSPQSIAETLAAAAHAARTVDEATRRACADFARQYDRDLQLAPRIAALRARVADADEPAAGAAESQSLGPAAPESRAPGGQAPS